MTCVRRKLPSWPLTNQTPPSQAHWLQSLPHKYNEIDQSGLPLTTCTSSRVTIHQWFRANSKNGPDRASSCRCCCCRALYSHTFHPIIKAACCRSSGSFLTTTSTRADKSWRETRLSITRGSRCLLWGRGNCMPIPRGRALAMSLLGIRLVRWACWSRPFCLLSVFSVFSL